MTDQSILNREIRLDFSGHEQTIHSRHAITPTSEHIDGPHAEPYPDNRKGRCIYLRLTIAWGQYAIPIVVSEDPEENARTVNIDRVLFHDERLRLEGELPDDKILRLTEAGMTQREHPFWNREVVSERIQDPDEVLWERILPPP